MKLIIKDSAKAQQWIELFKVIKNLNSYTTLCSEEDKLFIQIMDDSQVCLMNITIEKDWFDEYESNNETFSVLSVVVVKIFHLYTAGTILTINTNSEKMEINFKYPDKSEKYFELNLIDIDKDMLESQNIEGDVEFEIKTKVFDKYISEMQLFGESMELVCFEDNLYMKSYGEDGQYVLKLPHSNIDELIVEDELRLKTNVSLKYLSYISKVHNVFEHFRIKVQKECPIQVDILDENIEVRYYIAPKISDDEDNDEDDYREYIDKSNSYIDNDYETKENIII